MLERLRRQIDITADPVLIALLEELGGYPGAEGDAALVEDHDYASFVVPLRLHAGQGSLSFHYMTTLFGTPMDVTLAELAIESFFPADEATADTLRDLFETA